MPKMKMLPIISNLSDELKIDHIFMVENGVKEQKDPEWQKCQKSAMTEKFRWPWAMLYCTGLVFCEKNPIIRGTKALVAMAFVAMVVYQTSGLLKQLLHRRNYDMASARSLVMVNWLFQALLSMGFLFYWQWRGYLCRLMENCHCPKGCPLTGKVIKRTVAVYLTILIVAKVFGVAVIMFKCKFDKNSEPIIDNAAFKIYGTYKLWWLSILVCSWAMYTWVAVLTFFICIVTALHHELCMFNEKKLKLIGQNSDGNPDKIAEELQNLYVNHVELANRIRNIDHTFEVYTFAMIGSNVPTTIFCLLSFLMTFQASSWLGVLFNIPDLVLCLLELLGLTSAPAKVHARIREVECIIYGNMRIWQSYNSKIYRLASVFISHANQPNLGITLWGFAVVTKPLILTMISMTVTYLTFVLQVHHTPKNGEMLANVTMEN